MLIAKKIVSHKVKGASLFEILVVIALMGIITTAVIINLTPAITKGRSLEAKTQLQQLHSMQRLYHMEYAKYSTDMNAIGFVPNPTLDQGGVHYYEIQITEASGNNYVAIAKAVRDFDSDGTNDTWQIDASGKLTNTQPD